MKGKRSGFRIRDHVSWSLSTARGAPIEHDLGAYEEIVNRIRGIDHSALGEGALRQRVRDVRRRCHDEPPGELVPAFGLIAEACRRRLGLRPFDGQLIAGIAMHRGKLAQMQTGEGKTLAAVFPACLDAMSGIAVHVLTANDYLARRDAEWMRPVYELMGVSVAGIGGGSGPSERRAAYAADVTYLTAREAGFDYLRDGLCYSPADVVQRRLGTAIIDEADHILIDEARVPLVIAGAGEGSAVDPRRADAVAGLLRPGTDYVVDREGRRVSILLPGHRRIEEELGVDGIHEERGAAVFARMYAALHARELLRRGVDYVVKAGAIGLVDGFTGRIADRRQWPWGIQAALEAREGLAIRPEGAVYGSVTVQHYIGLYRKLAAMTATAVASAEELSECYGLATVIVPTEKPARRADEPDVVFDDRRAKMAAVAAEIARAHGVGRPVLVGTGSVAESEELACLLRGRGVACEVLNASNDEREAEVIARAGRWGSVTISTNMAGRGTDIRLPDDPRVFGLGGLYVIGTNRHESRRVDDQLRGRAGRQGEPGSSRFFISLEDPLFERYGVREFLPRISAAAAGSSGGAEERASSDPRVLREIDRAQSIIEAQHHATRRAVRKYSALVELDRRRVRELRDAALRDGELPPTIEEALAGAAPHRAMAVEAFLRLLDRFWADHLMFVEDVREGIGLERYAGREPGLEYIHRVGAAFEEGLAAVEEAVADACRRLPEDPEGLRPERMGTSRPSNTWTYQVDDEEPMRFSLSLVAGSNLAAALAAWPTLLIHAAAALARRVAGRPRSAREGRGTP